MGRERRAIKMTSEGNFEIARFVHPIFKRTVRVKLGPRGSQTAKDSLAALNDIFLSRELWRNLPEKLPECVRQAWLQQAAGVVAGGDSVSADGEDHPVDEGELARVLADNKRLNDENTELRAKVRKLERQIEDHLGRKYRDGPSPTLKVAAAQWISEYPLKSKSRDSEHARVVSVTINCFVKEFGENKTLEELEGNESAISKWLLDRKIKGGENKGKPISPTRMAAMRNYILKFLDEAGCRIDRELIAKPNQREIKEARGKIRWLERKDAERLAEKLPEYWQDIFRLQVAMGLRPSEVVTLKRGDFSKRLDKLTLSRLGHLTLKTGSRTLRVPVKVRPIIKRRLAGGEVLFADPATGKPWNPIEEYEERFRAALKTAKESAGIKVEVDSRIGRRTCASLLLRSGMSSDEVAELLGNTPEMVRDHYGRLLPQEIDPSKAALD